MPFPSIIKKFSLTQSVAFPQWPENPIAVIGDVHGRLDLLEIMLRRLAGQGEAGRLRVILVGDVIDRGPDSLKVLNLLWQLQADPFPFAEVVCLMGNHERMMLDFIDAPGAKTANWLVHGGEATLRSAGVNAHATTVATRGADERLMTLRDALCCEMTHGLIDWVRNLPMVWQEGALAVTHAGANPHRSLTAQADVDVMWGHRDFHRRRRSDGIWIVHGHFVVDEPAIDQGRIAVDTGAWRSNRLSSVMIGPEGLQFVTTLPVDRVAERYDPSVNQ